MNAQKEARNTNYLFMIGTDRKLSFSAQSSNVADLTLAPANFSTGAKELKYPDNVVTQVPLVVDVIVSETMYEWIAIYKWMMDCKNTNNGLEKTKTCFLSTLDSQNKETVTFTYSDAWPTELSGLQYVTTEDGSRILVVTVTLEYNLFNIHDHLTGEIIDERYVTE